MQNINSFGRSVIRVGEWAYWQEEEEEEKDSDALSSNFSCSPPGNSGKKPSGTAGENS
jgi:hypothetical protein